jgi:hypothetical protein
MGAPNLDVFSEENSYTSSTITTELLRSIDHVIRGDGAVAIERSPFVSVLCDESTDVSNTKLLIVYLRLFEQVIEQRVVDGAEQTRMRWKPGTQLFGVFGVLLYLMAHAVTRFGGIIPMPDGKAVTIVNALLKFCQDRNIKPDKLVGFGSDGASVMTGRKGGVHKLLLAHFPFLFGIHCIAHRLNLAATGAAKDKNIPYLKNKLHAHLTTLFWHFKASAVRTASLAALTELWDEPPQKV